MPRVQMIRPALRDWQSIFRPCKNTLREFCKQNSQEAGARRRPWRQRESLGWFLG